MIQIFNGENGLYIAQALIRSVLLCYLASLISAATMVSFALQRSPDSCHTIICAASYIVLVSAVTGLVGRASYRTLRDQLPVSATALILDLLRVAIWIVPLVVFAARRSAMGILAFGGFAFVSSKLIRHHWELGSINARPMRTSLECKLWFEFPELTGGSFDLLCLTTLICVAYFGVFAAMGGNSSFATLCMGSSGFLIVWAVRDYRGTERRYFKIRFSSLLISALLACVATFAGLSMQGRYLNLGFQPRNAYDNAEALDQFHSAVILLTHHHAKLPIIRPRADTPNAPKKHPRQRVNSILFSGEYWFSPAPLRHPPPSALREFGDPTSIKVTEQRLGHAARSFEMLVMRAQQEIGQSIDIRCCRRIDVVMRNEDLEPATVVVELILVNSASDEQTSLSLGEMALASAAEDSLAENLGVSGQSAQGVTRSLVLGFAVPRSARIRSFDKIIVWFHLKTPRSLRAARVAIQRFDLIQ